MHTNILEMVSAFVLSNGVDGFKNCLSVNEKVGFIKPSFVMVNCILNTVTTGQIVAHVAII